MDHNDWQDASSQQEPLLETGGSLGYGQGMEYYSLNPTQPLRLNLPPPPHPREERLQQLRAARLRRQQSRTQPHSLAFFKRKSGQETPTPQRMSILRAALIITAALVASRFLGVLRSSLFATVFAPGDRSDAYVQAFLVPDLVYNVVTGGALMSAFIPVFNVYMIGKRDEKTAWYVTSAALTLATVLMLVFAALAIIFAPQVVPLYNYGVTAAQLDRIVSLTRIMLLQAIIMGTGVIITSILNARQSFLLPAIGSVLYPLGLIGGLLPGLFQPNSDLAMYAATWGVVAGALLLVGIQVPGLLRAGMHYTFSLNWRHPGIVQIARQMVPRIINAAMINFSIGVDRFLISLLVFVLGLQAGLLTEYSYAFALVLIPLSGVIAVSTAAFPTMTEYAAEGRLDRLCIIVRETLKSTLFVSIPASVGLMVLGLPLIQVLYAHNASFTPDQAQSTAIPLLCFAVGLPGLALLEPLTRTFYALRSSSVPVVVSVGQFVFKIALSLLLINPAIWIAQQNGGSFLDASLPTKLLAGAWGMGALALATSVAVLLEAALLLWLLRQRMVELGLRTLLAFVLRVLLATVIMSLGLLLARWLLDTVLMTSSSGMQLLNLVLVLAKLLIIVCISSYIYLRVARLIHILNVEELGSIHRLLARLRLSWI
jgi:putative peptidoglycan lipid II flippase